MSAAMINVGLMRESGFPIQNATVHAYACVTVVATGLPFAAAHSGATDDVVCEFVFGLLRPPGEARYKCKSTSPAARCPKPIAHSTQGVPSVCCPANEIGPSGRQGHVSRRLASIEPPIGPAHVAEDRFRRRKDHAVSPAIDKNRGHVAVKVERAAAHDARKIVFQGFLKIGERRLQQFHSFRRNFLRGDGDCPIESQRRSAIRFVSILRSPIGNLEITHNIGCPTSGWRIPVQPDERRHVPDGDIGDKCGNRIEFAPGCPSFGVAEIFQ